MDAEASPVAVWQKCGGNGHNGETTCTAGNSCVKINDWYSQCQPNATPANKLNTWSQCAGSANNFQAGGKSCRDEDACVKYSDAYSQCVPKTQQKDAAAEMACTNVSVEGDATYCVEGAVCGGAGDKCPKKGDLRRWCQVRRALGCHVPDDQDGCQGLCLWHVGAGWPHAGSGHAGPGRPHPGARWPHAGTHERPVR
ncbi:hypothetical protein SDRG_03280 [Saprolegnia diclina VS20]|uniref:CBM1 domain-containing protein n=1 Tax=Saprolegnia diclina (strain VS20) TaxID=1156394 RepID=T0S8V3_SAPDV|nr:hypothetical protein SDRG_03280 [Saprolegnia diclina VS20]EQC39072.1 hypothetical protein SDRG_03280 [Saprolegnia diclina VS20]|eukprot:XP_008607133.1 hypothetical protein SDRG_03280 [Saprolegnia diclina VS20]